MRLSGTALATTGIVGTASANHLVVETVDASGVSGNQATLEGHLNRLGDATSAECYFEWGRLGEGLPNTTVAQTLTDHGDFSETIEFLASDTLYEFRAVADGSDGETDTGAIGTFETDTDGMIG